MSVLPPSFVTHQLSPAAWDFCYNPARYAHPSWLGAWQSTREGLVLAHEERQISDWLLNLTPPPDPVFIQSNTWIVGIAWHAAARKAQKKSEFVKTQNVDESPDSATPQELPWGRLLEALYAQYRADEITQTASPLLASSQVQNQKNTPLYEHALTYRRLFPTLSAGSLWNKKDARKNLVLEKEVSQQDTQASPQQRAYAGLGLLYMALTHQSPRTWHRLRLVFSTATIAYAEKFAQQNTQALGNKQKEFAQDIFQLANIVGMKE